MAIDLLNLEPTKISRDLKGKYIFAYGAAKIGKTSLIASFPKSLIFSFEPGTNALDNIYKIYSYSHRSYNKFELSQFLQEAFLILVVLGY